MFYRKLKTMKTIGLIGGMSWESTREYYDILNRMASETFGGSHSCPSLIHSFDFEEIENLQHAGQWDGLKKLLVNAALNLQRSGAQVMVICTNTMHKLFEEIEKELEVPLVHIADAVAAKIKSSGMKTIGLLGTRFTMEGEFYKERLLKNHNIQTLVPGETQRAYVHETIYRELVQGELNDSSRKEFVKIIHELHKQGAEGIILGCTEIPLLINQEDTSVPLFNSTLLHAEAAFRLAVN